MDNLLRFFKRRSAQLPRQTHPDSELRKALRIFLRRDLIPDWVYLEQPLSQHQLLSRQAIFKERLLTASASGLTICQTRTFDKAFMS
jgi:hypothetical protein